MTKPSLFLFKITAILCFYSTVFSDLCLADQNQHSNVLVKKIYPGAQFWFNSMIKKYPQAHLKNVLFCVADEHKAGTGVIYFPEDVLQEMDEVFGSIDPEDVIDDMFKQFAEHEYLMMHEAHHVLQGDFQKGEIAFGATMLALPSIALALIVKSIGQKNVSGQDMALAVAGSVAIVTAMFSYARYQERNADDFANQHADKQALKAGANWFAASNDYKNMNLPEAYKQFLMAIDDPAHPSLQSREDKVRDTLWLRLIS